MTCTIVCRYGSTAEQLKQYRVTVSPPRDIWVDVGDEVKFMQQTTEDDSDEEDDKKKKSQKLSTTKIVFVLSCDATDGDKRIDNFINSAFEWYSEELLKTRAQHTLSVRPGCSYSISQR